MTPGLVEPTAPFPNMVEPLLEKLGRDFRAWMRSQYTSVHARCPCHYIGSWSSP